MVPNDYHAQDAKYVYLWRAMAVHVKTHIYKAYKRIKEATDMSQRVILLYYNKL